MAVETKQSCGDPIRAENPFEKRSPTVTGHHPPRNRFKIMPNISDNLVEPGRIELLTSSLPG